MSYPESTVSMIAPLMMRTDLPKEIILDHWQNGHADKVSKLPNLVEYNQLVFSPDDHGFWPTSGLVGGDIPPDWQLDGAAELRFGSAMAMVSNGFLHGGEIFRDEQNIFHRVIGQVTIPWGGRWWTDGLDTSFDARVAVLFRRRKGTGLSGFRHFLYNSLGPVLNAAGARDLRAYAHFPYTGLENRSLGVNHGNPVQFAYHGSVFFGAENRDAVTEILASPEVTAVIGGQERYFTAVHAYAVEQTVSVVRGGVRQ
jgi:hypothetical protein